MSTQTLEAPQRNPAAPTPRSAPRWSGQSAGRSLLRQTPWLLLTVAVGAMVLVPVIPLQMKAFGNGAEGLKSLTQMDGLGGVLLTTVVLGLGALAVALVLGTLLALSMYTMSPRARKYLSFTPVLPMVVPSVAHVVGFVFLFSPENGYVNTMLRATPFFGGTSGPINVYTPFWIVVYTGVHLAAFVYLFVFTGLKNMGADYALAARVNGASGLRALLTITLPLLRPVFVYAGAVCFLLSLGQFTGPLILGRREGVSVVTTRMFELTLQYPVDYPLVAALGTPLIVVAMLLVLLQRRMIGNQNRFVGQVTTTDSRSTNPWVTAATSAFVLVFTLLSAVLPLLALAFVSLSRFWSGQMSVDSLSLDAYRVIFDDPVFRESMVTSFGASMIAVALVLPLGLAIALGIYNKDRLWRPLPPILDFAANLPLTLPAALVGFGFLFALSDPAVGLYGTRASFILAYVTIMIPYAVRYQLATLVALGRQTVESSRVSGAGAARTFLVIVLPLARAGIASSAAIMFILLIHEFGVSLLLRSPNVNVMSVVLFEQYDVGSYPQVAAIAIVMTLITAAGVFVALLFGGSRALDRL